MIHVVYESIFALWSVIYGCVRKRIRLHCRRANSIKNTYQSFNWNMFYLWFNTVINVDQL